MILLKYNIKNIDDCVSYYIRLIKDNIIKHPIIFTDKLEVSIQNIPVFHSFYASHPTIAQNILINYNDYIIAQNIYSKLNKFIVLCENKKQLLSNNNTTFLLNNKDTYDRLQQIVGQ